jgi:hypothetical protein
VRRPGVHGQSVTVRSMVSFLLPKLALMWVIIGTLN